jgi:hypothetical protein
MLLKNLHVYRLQQQNKTINNESKYLSDNLSTFLLIFNLNQILLKK